MDFDRARDDLFVAGTAAACAIALTLGLEYGVGTTVPVYYRLTPLLVYVLYTFTRKGGPYGRYDTLSTWIVLTILVTGATAFLLA